MHTVSLKNIFHAGDFTSPIEAVMFVMLSLSILTPLVLFLYGIFCLIMCFVQNICIN